jgi:hypothetical protein
MFERIEARQQQDGLWQRRWPLVNLEEAIADLSLRLQKLRPQQQLSESKFLHPALLQFIEFYGESYHDYCNK